MSCEDRKPLITLYAADAVDAEEREALDAHLATGCERCRRELDAATASLARIGLLADRKSPPPGLEERLMREIRGAGGATGAPPTASPRAAPRRAPPRGRIRRVWPAAVAAAAAAVVAAFSTWLLVPREPRLDAELAAERERASDLEARWQAASARLDLLEERLRTAEQIGAEAREEELAGRIEALERELTRASEARGRLEQELAASESALEERNRELARRGETVESERDRIASLRREKALLEERAQRLEENLADARAASQQAQELENEVARERDRLAAARQALSVLEREPERIEIASGDVSARMYWDYDERDCFLRAEGLDPGRYALWLESGTRKRHHVGDFEVGRDGHGDLLGSLPGEGFGRLRKVELFAKAAPGTPVLEACLEQSFGRGYRTGRCS